MRKRTVDLEEGGFVQTSASRSIPHFLKAGECTGHVLTWFCGGRGCVLGVFWVFLFFFRSMFLFDPLFLNIFNSHPFLVYVFYFIFFPMKYSSENGKPDSLQFFEA